MLLIRPLTAKEQKGYTHAMHRIPPSQKIGKKAEELLKQGLDGEAGVTSPVVRQSPIREEQLLVDTTESRAMIHSLSTMSHNFERTVVNPRESIKPSQMQERD